MAHLEIYEEKRYLKRRTQWRWRIRGANHKIIATSGEGYNNRADLWHAINLIRNTFMTVSIPVRDNSDAD